MMSSKDNFMFLKYQDAVMDQDINVRRLRPAGSYDNLIANRNHALKGLISTNGQISHQYLMERLCPSCGSDKYEVEFVKDHLNVVSCKSCLLVYVNPVLKPEICENIYLSAEYSDIVKSLIEESHNYRKQRFGYERINNIERYTPRTLPKRLLEIGCSTGFLLEAARERGWEVTGIEVNPSAVKFGRERGLTIIDRPIEQVDFSSQHRFSAVAMYDVIEHLIDPAKTLAKAREILVNEGAVFIYVPNFQSASKEIMGVQNAHFIWPTHHLTYFTPLTLRDFLQRLDFEVVHWETQGLDIEDWLWYLKEKTDYDTTLIEENSTFFQFVINASGYGKNLRMYARKVAVNE
ncbi:MAG: class I SAM-dependent methyltransferase [Planctomycetota bacterium]|jgi:2-polyprenyl-3-methyl-5-hydroxy-6-metoxy-1,4-benzoquinol methylase